MSLFRRLKPADFGGEIRGLENAGGKALYKRATLVWSDPQDLDSEKSKPFFEDNRPLLYAIMRNHHRMGSKNAIRYIGLSETPRNRFANHPKAVELVKMRGLTSLSYAYLDIGRSSQRIGAVKRALEEIEHILIWALWEKESLLNDRKVFTLPGMGVHAGQAWQILNVGFRFSGRMPREIVYPWMLVERGRDRSAKKK